MMEWLSIDSAPTDGTEFQGWVVNGPASFWEPRCRFNENGALEMWGRIDYDQDGWEVHPFFTATHWMPHPSPPVKEE